MTSTTGWAPGVAGPLIADQAVLGGVAWSMLVPAGIWQLCVFLCQVPGYHMRYPVANDNAWLRLAICEANNAPKTVAILDTMPKSELLGSTSCESRELV